MNFRKKKYLPIFLICIVSSAEILADPGQWYIGGSTGFAQVNGLANFTTADLAQAIEVTGISPQVTPSIVGTSNSSEYISANFDEFAWKLNAGYRLNDYLGLEALYAKLGSFERKARLTGGVSLFSSASLREETEAEGYGVSLVGSYPLTPAFSVFAKVGFFHWKTETSANMAVQTGTTCNIIFCFPDARDESFSMNSNGTDPMYGLGVAISRGSWALRAEWERFSGLRHGIHAEAEIDLMTLGVEYQFSFED